jgi:AraC-like DNA-binding protein
MYLSKLYAFNNPFSRLLHQVQIIGFGVLLPVQIFFLIRKYLIVIKVTKTNISNNPQILSYFNIQWALFIFIGVLIFIISNIVFFFISEKTILTIAFYNLLMLLSGGIIGYLGMKQDSLYNQVSKIQITHSNNRHSSRKKDKQNGNSDINDNQVEFIKNLREFLATEKTYMNKNLTAYDLAKGLGTSTRELSNIINNSMHTNFHGLINEYRVLEAKEMLRRKEYANLKIEVISNKVGFRSKSSFNACFKSITGKTPSEYRNEFFKQ